MNPEEYLNNEYRKRCSKKSDINEHLPVLKSYGEKCSHITEFGLCGANSTIALLNSYPKRMISYDIMTMTELRTVSDIDKLLEVVKEANIDFELRLENDLEIEIEPTDLLFIDTFHIYQQLIQELNLHHKKVSKWILIHDSEKFKYTDIRITEVNKDSPKRGLMSAIDEFLETHFDWKIENHLKNCNGLTILGKLE